MRSDLTQWELDPASLVNAGHVLKLHSGLWGDHDLRTALVPEAWCRTDRRLQIVDRTEGLHVFKS